MKKEFLLLALLITAVAAILYGCGPLLGRPPDDTEPTDIDLFGEENTITISIRGRNSDLVIPANGHFKHFTIPGSDSIPEYSALLGGGNASINYFSFQVIQDGTEVQAGGYDGVSSLFSLDGLVYFNLEIHGKVYTSLVYGTGAGGTTVYYDSWFTIVKIHTTDYLQPEDERRVLELKGLFKAYLKERGAPDDAASILMEGKINYVSDE